MKFYSRVKSVERKKRLVRAWKDEDQVRTQYGDLGWFMLLEGSWEYLYVGEEEPDFKVGDDVMVIIEKR